ncbi:MAG: phospho-N-acetylmuramoyl-pentapeptide-transferase, partial [Eubacterium sp.]|nr:phospho-N-acetylmuramoyl-pentapeptide-transferase [Candidatus Colimonas fimequi]
MFYVLALIVMAAIISSVITKFEIPILREKAGQNIREDGPQSHLKKAGTPSMGGIAMIISAFAVSIVGGIFFEANMVEVLLIDLVFVGFGFVGFIDDYRKVIKKVNEGLKPKEKMALLILISAILAVVLFIYEGGQVWIPFVKIYVDFGILYIPFIIFVAIAMTNAVNLTDGLDGLASGATALTTMFFTIAGLLYGVYSGAYFCAALCGACLGFLVWNKNPAKVFMGDTGSLALGGGLAAAAIVMKL